METHALPVAVRDEAVVVTSGFWGISAYGAEDRVRTEEEQEETLEFLAEGNVDDEIDARVDGDQEVADGD